MIVRVYFYKNGIVIGDPVFGTTHTISNWTALEIPMTYNTSDTPDSATIYFVIGAYIQHSESILYIDNMSFDSFITSVPEQTADEIPIAFVLSQNYPNPFNPSTTISFTLPLKSFVALKVFDIIGQEVATLVNKELSEGTHIQQWNAVNLASGIYFYRLQVGTFTETKKLVLLR